MKVTTRRHRFLAAAVLAALGLQLASFGESASLRKLALEAPNGETVVYLEPDSEQTFTDLQEISQYSDAAVIGSVLSNLCSLSDDEETIHTDFRFLVEKTFWGRVREGSEIVVRVPGGKIHFPTGETAEVVAGWFKSPEPGRRYVLLLQSSGRRWRDFSPTGGPQGIFELSADGRMQVSSGRRDDPVWTYGNMSSDEFLSLLREVADPPGASASATLLAPPQDHEGQIFSRLFPFHRSGVRLDLVFPGTVSGQFRNRAGEMTFSTGVYPGIPARMEGDDRSILEVEAENADLAVVGVVKSRRSLLTENREFVFSIYTLEVEETLKDSSKTPVPAGSTVEVVAPGGRVRINGVFVRADDAAIRPFQVGGRCLLLLKYIPSTEAYMAQANGSFQFLSDRVAALRWGQESRDLVQDRSPAEFLREVRAAVARIGSGVR